MRIVAWNANYNAHKKRPFEEAAEIAFGQGADMAILSEVARPSTDVPGRIAWIGRGNPGLGVEARNGYTIRRHDSGLPAPELFGAYHVSGPLPFNLLAAWPVQYPKSPSYGRSLLTALDVFRDFLSAERTILVGDLNSSTRIFSQRNSHPEFVRQARELQLESLYHYAENVEQGRELQGTYRHHGKPEQSFHIDYCFLSPTLLKKAEMKILDGPRWEKLSDHFPIQVDIRVDA